MLLGKVTSIRIRFYIILGFILYIYSLPYPQSTACISHSQDEKINRERVSNLGKKSVDKRSVTGLKHFIPKPWSVC